MSARAGVRARAWGGVAVVGRNPGEQGKGAVGPSHGGDRRRYGTAPPSGCGGLWRWVLGTLAGGQKGLYVMLDARGVPACAFLFLVDSPPNKSPKTTNH